MLIRSQNKMVIINFGNIESIHTVQRGDEGCEIEIYGLTEEN